MVEDGFIVSAELVLHRVGLSEELEGVTSVIVRRGIGMVVAVFKFCGNFILNRRLIRSTGYGRNHNPVSRTAVCIRIPFSVRIFELVRVNAVHLRSRVLNNGTVRLALAAHPFNYYMLFVNSPGYRPAERAEIGIRLGLFGQNVVGRAYRKLYSGGIRTRISLRVVI